MILAEALATLEETAEQKTLRHVIAGMCIERYSVGDISSTREVGAETARLTKYCLGERLERTAAQAAISDSEIQELPRTQIAVAERLSV